MYLTVCPLRGPGSITGCGEVFQWTFRWLITHALREELGDGNISRDVSLTGHTLSIRFGPACRKWLNLPSMAPLYLWTWGRKAKVQLWADNS